MLNRIYQFLVSLIISITLIGCYASPEAEQQAEEVVVSTSDPGFVRGDFVFEAPTWAAEAVSTSYTRDGVPPQGGPLFPPKQVGGTCSPSQDEQGLARFSVQDTIDRHARLCGEGVCVAQFCYRDRRATESGYRGLWCFYSIRDLNGDLSFAALKWPSGTIDSRSSHTSLHGSWIGPPVFCQGGVCSINGFDPPIRSSVRVMSEESRPATIAGATILFPAGPRFAGSLGATLGERFPSSDPRCPSWQ